jgi:hypothetical protein
MPRRVVVEADGSSESVALTNVGVLTEVEVVTVRIT